MAISSRVANCESRGCILFRKIGLPHKPRALCGRFESGIKTDKTIVGVGHYEHTIDKHNNLCYNVRVEL